MSEEKFFTNKSDEEIERLVQKAVTNVMQTQNAEHDYRKEEKQELVNRKELCVLLKISTASLYRRMRDGSIPYISLKRRVLFDVNNVLESIKGRDYDKKCK